MFWASGIRNVKACPFCCAGSKCQKLIPIHDTFFLHHKSVVVHKTDNALLYFVFGRSPVDKTEGIAPGHFSITYYSWNSALSLCKEIDGYLPVFSSKSELEEFVSLIKLGTFITIDAIFCGIIL